MAVSLQADSDVSYLDDLASLVGGSVKMEKGDGVLLLLGERPHVRTLMIRRLPQFSMSISRLVLVETDSSHDQFGRAALL